MQEYISSSLKLGILGGGQLGRMLLQALSKYDIHTEILDPNPEAPAAHMATRFHCGSFKDYDTVLAFGKNVDTLTVEIEDVNTEALRELEKQGKKVYPQPKVLDTIRDKGLQKSFYQEHKIPTAPFFLVADPYEIDTALQQRGWTYPVVQKMRTGGYDGKGVSILKSAEEAKAAALPGPSVIEQMAPIQKELAIIVAGSDANPDPVCFPTVEMLFNPEANLVEFLASPAQVPHEVTQKANDIAQQLYKTLGMRGLLAVELFWNTDGSVWVNEVAPRPHNSGHHTIEGNLTSQFEQHFRSVLNGPLGSTETVLPGVMVNLLGAPKAQGNVVYKGLDQVLQESGIYPHVYGKKQVSPYRKMGHVTCLAPTLEEAIAKGRLVKEKVIVDGQ